MNEYSERALELNQLAERLGVSIANWHLYDQALTHASTVGDIDTEQVAHYESLEFLGDAVLGLVVSHYLFDFLPNRTPGEYSRMRAGIINRRCVGRVAQSLDLAPAIRLGKGEEQSGGRNRLALLSDCLEALIGAIYLDKGWQIAHDFVVRAFGEELSRCTESDLTWDYKSRLQNLCQARKINLPIFNVVRSEGPDHEKEFEIEVLIQKKSLGRGTGKSKKEAEQNAARKALEHEDSIPVIVDTDD